MQKYNCMKKGFLLTGPPGIGKCSGERIAWLVSQGYDCTIITFYPLTGKIISFCGAAVQNGKVANGMSPQFTEQGAWYGAPLGPDLPGVRDSKAG